MERTLSLSSNKRGGKGCVTMKRKGDMPEKCAIYFYDFFKKSSENFALVQFLLLQQNVSINEHVAYPQGKGHIFLVWIDIFQKLISNCVKINNSKDHPPNHLSFLKDNCHNAFENSKSFFQYCSNRLLMLRGSAVVGLGLIVQYGKVGLQASALGVRLLIRAWTQWQYFSHHLKKPPSSLFVVVVVVAGSLLRR